MPAVVFNLIADCGRLEPICQLLLFSNVHVVALQEEPCPICYEDMAGQDIDLLVWCHGGCGRNVHGRCMG